MCGMMRGVRVYLLAKLIVRCSVRGVCSVLRTVLCGVVRRFTVSNGVLRRFTVSTVLYGAVRCCTVQ
jgi:hypothetical protein